MAAQKREQFANNAVDELDGSIDASQTTFDVLDASAFPTDGDFRILVESEIMLVTGVSSETFTVIRGYEGTTGASHSSSATVTLLLTEGAISRLITDSVPWGYLSARPPLGRIVDENDAVIDTSDFSWIYQGNAVAVDRPGFMHIEDFTGAGNHFIRGLFRNAPATPYSLTVCLDGVVYPTGAFPGFGIAFYESGTGKLVTLSVDIQGAETLAVGYWTTVTSNSSTPFSQDWMRNRGPIWWRISDDGTNLKFESALNGMDWKTLFNPLRGAFLTTGPDQVGFYVNRGNNSSDQGAIDILHWSYD